MRNAKAGRAPQLALEAAIAAAGGFPGYRRGRWRSCAIFRPPAASRPVSKQSWNATPPRWRNWRPRRSAGLARLIAQFDAARRLTGPCGGRAFAMTMMSLRIWRASLNGRSRATRRWRESGSLAAPLRAPPRARPPSDMRRCAPRRCATRRWPPIPTASAWVSANAGTGKTHVLTNRVLRLLLAGTPAERILALTYTKAAAAEMAKRVFQRLAEWTTADRALEPNSPPCSVVRRGPRTAPWPDGCWRGRSRPRAA